MDPHDATYAELEEHLFALQRKGQSAFAALRKAVEECDIEITQVIRASHAEGLQKLKAEQIRKSDEMHSAAARLIMSEQKERERLSQILHNDLQQLLVAAGFGLKELSRHHDARVREVALDVKDCIDKSIAVTRSLTSEFNPPVLYKAGLSPALRGLERWMQDKHQLQVHCEISNDISLAHSQF